METSNQQQWRLLSSRTMRASDRMNPVLHTFCTSKSFEEFDESANEHLNDFDWMAYDFLDAHELSAILEVEGDDKSGKETKEVKVTMNMKFIDEEQAKKRQYDVKGLGNDVHVTFDYVAEFFMTPYDASHDEVDVDIDLLYRWQPDRNPLKRHKLRLRTHQERIPRVPLHVARETARVLWTYLGCSEMDQFGHLVVTSYVSQFIRSFPNDDEHILERIKDCRGIRAAKACAYATQKGTPGIQFRKYISPDNIRCIVVYAGPVGGYTAEDGFLDVYYRWRGTAVEFLITKKNEL